MSPAASFLALSFLLAQGRAQPQGDAAALVQQTVRFEKALDISNTAFQTAVEALGKMKGVNNMLQTLTGETDALDVMPILGEVLNSTKFLDAMEKVSEDITYNATELERRSKEDTLDLKMTIKNETLTDEEVVQLLQAVYSGEQIARWRTGESFGKHVTTLLAALPDKAHEKVQPKAHSFMQSVQDPFFYAAASYQTFIDGDTKPETVCRELGFILRNTTGMQALMKQRLEELAVTATNLPIVARGVVADKSTLIQATVAVNEFTKSTRRLFTSFEHSSSNILVKVGNALEERLHCAWRPTAPVAVAAPTGAKTV